MPPATEPIPWLILENMRTTLAGVNGGSSYFYTFNVVKVAQDVFSANVFPAVTIGHGDVSRLEEMKDGRALWTNMFQWRVPVVVVLDGFLDMQRRLLEVLHDVMRALGADYTRGGNAKSTTVVGTEVLASDDQSDTRGWIAVWVDVIFRVKENDMLTVY